MDSASPEIEIVCAVEGAYVAHCAAMLHSVLAAHAPGDVRIHVLHGPDLSGRARGRLGGMVDRCGAGVSFLAVPDEWCVGLPTEGFTGKATWYRIFVPQLLPDRDRALFLDLDLIVRKGLGPLWETDLSGCYLAAVTNVFPPELAARVGELGYAGERDYFNAGVLLMNLDLLRNDGCSQELHDYAAANAAELVMRDQDALNAVLGRRRRRLEPRWNCMNSFFMYPAAEEIFEPGELDEARRNPAIRHFEGPGVMKPWHYGCDRPMRELYFEHRSQTPWPRVRREGHPVQRALAPIEARARRVARRLLRV